MAFDAFLKLDGIDGESTDKNHLNEIEILSYSWGVSNPNSGSSGGGGGTGRPSFSDVSFESLLSKAGPNLMLACATGKHLRSALLTVRKSGGNGLEFLKITLSDVLVSTYQESGDATAQPPRPADSFSLNFDRIDVLYTAQSGETVETTFDLR